jgi:hypothetical protein
MKIRVLNKEEKINIRLALPLCLIKSKLVISSIIKNSKMDIKKEVFTDVYQILKEYIKENGHFTIVEVEAKDGTYVKIRV